MIERNTSTCATAAAAAAAAAEGMRARIDKKRKEETEEGDNIKGYRREEKIGDRQQEKETDT